MNLEEKGLTNNLDDLVNQIQSINIEDRNTLEDVLKDLECPFTWNINKIVTSKNMINYLLDKGAVTSDDIEDHEKYFSWNYFNNDTALSYLLTMNGQNTEASEIIEDLKSKYLRVQESESTECLCEKIKVSIWHVLSASEIFIFLKSDNKTIKEKHKFVKDALLNIKPFSNMTNEEKAGVCGMKSAMFAFFGHDGNIIALDEAKAARDLDPQMAEWWHMIGKYMGRIRRINARSDCVDKEEIKVLEKAIELDNNNPRYRVFLAQVYRECASAAFLKFKNEINFKTHELGDFIKQLNQKALDLYLQSIKDMAHCSKTLSRCAIGIVKLPKQFNIKHLNVAEKAIIKSLEINPNNGYVQHVAGMFYRKDGEFQNLEKALYHFEKASEMKNFPSSLDLLRLKCYLNPDHDLYADLMKLNTMYIEEYTRIQLTCHIGSYYMFKKRDILTAIQYYNEVLEKNQQLLFKPSFVPFLNLVRGPLVLIEIAVNEANLALKEISTPQENKLVIENFLTKIADIEPEVLDSKPDPLCIHNIISFSISNSKNQSTDRPRNRYTEGKPRGGYGNRSEGRQPGSRNNWRNTNKNCEDKQSNWRREKGTSNFVGVNRNYQNDESYNPGKERNQSQNWRSHQNSEKDHEENIIKKDPSRHQMESRCWRTKPKVENEADKASNDTYRFPLD